MKPRYVLSLVDRRRLGDCRQLIAGKWRHAAHAWALGPKLLLCSGCTLAVSFDRDGYPIVGDAEPEEIGEESGGD
jgi:hypothetical protein